MKQQRLLFLLGLLLFSGCKQDFDLTAKYQEVPLVYGLLNIAETTHYIRIQKGFLMDGNAYTATGIADSIYYKDSLTVKLIPFYNGNQNGQIFTLHRITLPKDSGTFASDANVLYTFTGNLDQSRTYRLEVTNNTNGYTFSSGGVTGIKLVKDFTIVIPPYKGYKMPLNTANPTKIIWYSAENAALYDLRVRFPYKEYDLQSNALLADTFADILMFQSKAAGTSGGASLYEDFTGATLLNALQRSLKANSEHYRVFNSAVGMTLYFSAAGPELASYINSQNAQSSGLVANEALPPFTNIQGGYGVFSSRYYKQQDSVLLTLDAIDTLACSTLTNGLNFKDSHGHLCQ